MKTWFRKRWVQNAGLVVLTAAVAYAMIYVDVIARAREAYRQGEKYMAWYERPEEKKTYLENKFIKEKSSLEKKRAKGKISEEEFAQNLEILQFDRDQMMTESSIKYAYQWYKDTYELFSPPESKWVRQARFLAPMAKELWRDELRGRRIPFEEYMLDLEAGEEEGTLSVLSTRRRELAEEWREQLRKNGIEAKLYDAPAAGRLPQEGLKIIVPRETFWQAHELLKPALSRTAGLPTKPGAAAP